MNQYLSNLKNDIPAGVVVFLVAVPLCLGIALASGAPLFSGIIAGILGGIVVGAFSGSSLGVSGPAAGLIAIVLPAIADLGFEIFLVAVLLSGVIQLILGFLRAGIIGYYFPSAVIKGMLSAIGIIIVLKQIPHAVGYDKDPEGDMAFVQPDGHTTFSELYYMLDFITPGAVIVTLVSLAILILWEQKFMKKIKLFQIIQGPLIVVVFGIILNLIFKSSESLVLAQEHLVNLPVVNELAGLSKLVTFPDFAGFGITQVYVVALTMAVVASLETLLCVEATDKLDPEKRITPTNRELKAQGIGNVISGFIGGLPITQVIVRSSANIQSGGKTKAAAIYHGVIMLVSALAIPHVLNLIPLASLASILFLVGYKLAKPMIFKDMYKQGWDQFIPFFITVVAIVFTDLLIGILIGLAVGIAFVVRSNYHSAFTKVTKDNQVLIKFNKDVNFIHKVEIMKALNSVPPNSKLIIDGANAWYIDQDVFEMMEDFVQSAQAKKIDIELIHFNNRKAKNTNGPIQKTVA